MAIARNSTLNFFLDLLFISLAFIICVGFKSDAFEIYIYQYANSFSLFVFIWISNSFLFKKYRHINSTNINDVTLPIIKSNLLTFGMVASLMYIIRIAHFSRIIVLGTIGITTILELIFASIFYYARNSTILSENFTEKLQKTGNGNATKSKNIFKPRRQKTHDPRLKSREEALYVEINKTAFNFIFQFADIQSPETLIINTTSRFNISSQLKAQFESIVNIRRINDIRYLNKFFESVNNKLPVDGIFIDQVETKNLRKQRILQKYPPVINHFVYALDFIVKRIFPKFSLTKKIYFLLTRGNNRVLTKAETFGRLYSCGFEIIAEKFIDNHLYFVARKTGEPMYPKDPTYGPFVRLKRIGRYGKIIKVYKLRTMHPYAEYLQDYMFKSSGLKEGGKFKNDYRVSSLGKLMRALWIDELPMLYNIIKGDLKIVGVRPLSKHYFELYPKNLQEKRIKYKPGLVPPFYADNPKSLDEIVASELKYLNAYEKHPLRTDLAYFFKSVYNIIFKKLRSS